MTHEVKCWPDHFQPQWDGLKDFEIRANDRTPQYAVGDFLNIREFSPRRDRYTGREITRWIKYIDAFGQPKGQVVLGLGEGMMRREARETR